jgi:hypothetical protein
METMDIRQGTMHNRHWTMKDRASCENQRSENIPDNARFESVGQMSESGMIKQKE